PRAMLDVLRDVFAALPPELVLACSFDTMFQGGTLSRLPYWAVGLSTGHAYQTSLFPFDLGRRQFLSAVRCRPTTVLEQAITRDRKRVSVADWKQYIGDVHDLECWLTGRSETPPDLNAKKDLVRLLVKHKSRRLAKRVKECLRHRLIEELGRAL